MNDFQAITNSALWAAYGDALGFMTELASEGDVKRRTGQTFVERTLPWKRRIGGKFGIDVPLPAGAYSDDTQLRLSTSRAIRADGRFDVEAFAKVELPVWLSYALGAGLGTREAATSLVRHINTWNSNFHKRYVNGGGNGAAMRIQPHVWASTSFQADEFLPDVLRNAIVTHGHPRALVGAAFHASVLGETIRRGSIPSIPELVNVLDGLKNVTNTLRGDRDLADLWVHHWQQASKDDLTASIELARAELLAYLESLLSLGDSRNLVNLYRRAVATLEARNSDSIGYWN